MSSQRRKWVQFWRYTTGSIFFCLCRDSPRQMSSAVVHTIQATVAIIPWKDGFTVKFVHTVCG